MMEDLVNVGDCKPSTQEIFGDVGCTKNMLRVRQDVEWFPFWTQMDRLIE